MRLLRNLSTNILNFLVNILIGLWLPPYIINKLGVEAYGLIPLANSISSYAVIISISINGSIARYLIIDIEKNNIQDANKTFNSALWGLSAILLLITPILILVAFNIQNLINVPFSIISDANFLFLFVFLSFIISNFTSLLNTSPYINNRLDLINATNLTQSTIRLISIISIFALLSISLASVGIASIIAAIIALIISFIFFKKQTPLLKLNIKYFNFDILKEILSMGGWLLVSQIGALLFLQVDLIVINVVAGAEAAGNYSVLLPWNSLIRSFAAVLAGVIAPIILQYYAKNKIDSIIKITLLSIKYLGIFISIIVANLCIFSKDILTIWLGPEFSSLSLLFIVLVSHLGINLSILPLYSISNAYKKVKIPGIVTIILGGINVALAVILLKYTSLHLYGVALASFIVLTGKNILFAAPYTAYILGLKKTIFLKKTIPALITFLTIFFIGRVIHDYIFVNTWKDLLIFFPLFTLLSGTLILIILSNKDERMTIKNTIFKSNNI